MQRLGVTVLGVLDEKDHQKRDNVGNAVDDQLPRIRKVKIRPSQRPDYQADKGPHKGVRMSDELSGPAGKAAEPQLDSAGFGQPLTSFEKRGLSFVTHKG